MYVASLCHVGTMRGKHRREHLLKIIDSDFLTFLKHADPIDHQIYDV